MKEKTANNAPYPLQVEEGKTYQWCSCGISEHQPLCDGMHRATECEPFEYLAKKTETVYFCGCKQSENSPLCDGTHKKL
jgi:CDGSH-type Zn-finger protein